MTVATLPLRPVEQPDANSFEHLRQLANELRTTSREAAATLVEIGTKLRTVKETYPQYFEAWARTELQWPMRLVAQYLRIGRDFGDIDWSRAQADPQALLVLTSQWSAAGEHAVTAAREVLQSGELLTEARAKNIKRFANVEVYNARKPAQPPQRQQYIPAYPIKHTISGNDEWVTLPEIRTAVMNLQVALIEVYGQSLYPSVRRALDELQQLIGASERQERSA